MARLPGAVVVLGGVSLLNDAASDMIAPLLPLFLTAGLGAGAAAVGLIEGVAETLSSLLRLVAGRLADRGLPLKGLTLAGYGLSNALRPLIGLAGAWPVVLALRAGDRVGKGLRSAPRDALIAAVTPPAVRGRAFGLQRALDHLGAVAGPLAASALLAAGLATREVFLLSAVPGALAVALLAVGVREPRRPASPGPAARLPAWKDLPAPMRRLVSAAGLAKAAELPDAFVVLWLAAKGFPPVSVPLLWAGLHAVRALVALPCGRLADRLGPRAVVVTGWGLRAALLALMPWTAGAAASLLALAAYAGATAATEAAERAFVAGAVSERWRGSAYGWYHLATGLAALPAGVWIGAVWQLAGLASALSAAALGAAAAALALARAPRTAAL